MSVGTSAELCSRGARKAPAPIPDSTHGMRNSFLSMDRTGAEVTPPAAVQRGDSVAVVSAVPASSTPSVYVSSYGGLAPRGSVSATPALPVLPISSGPLHASLAGGMQLRLPSMDAVPRPAGQSVPSAVSFPAGNFAVAAPRAPSSRAVLASKLRAKDFLPDRTVSAFFGGAAILLPARRSVGAVFGLAWRIPPHSDAACGRHAWASCPGAPDAQVLFGCDAACFLCCWDAQGVVLLRSP
jgi:hypothetical protein